MSVSEIAVLLADMFGADLDNPTSRRRLAALISAASPKGVITV